MPRAYVRITCDAIDDPKVTAAIHHLLKVVLQAYRPPQGMKLVGIMPTLTDPGRAGGDELVFDVDPTTLRRAMQSQGIRIPSME